MSICNIKQGPSRPHYTCHIFRITQYIFIGVYERHIILYEYAGTIDLLSFGGHCVYNTYHYLYIYFIITETRAVCKDDGYASHGQKASKFIRFIREQITRLHDHRLFVLIFSYCHFRIICHRGGHVNNNHVMFYRYTIALYVCRCSMLNTITN